ncbi:hypothetical protein [Reichenbachiella sp. MALMAid0571]|uniref:hypothetical protein n=1 Tax=Reichenbachiella sp. MALMAid0571 TaxID=3143939 RepID=UPI0032DE3CE9
MSTTPTYLNNSAHKDLIREKWVEFIRECVSHDNGVGVITFPAEEMHDLYIFKNNGLIDWEENETGTLTITKGKVVCFEKRSKIFMTLSTKLVNAVVESQEIGSHLRQKYEGIMRGSERIFPVDAVNLDYDGNISKNKVPIDEKVDLIFKFQAVHKRSFSFFMTWPSTEDDDEEAYKSLLKKTISSNLKDPSAILFKEEFDKRYQSIDDLDYDNLSIIGLTKIVLKKASNSHFRLVKHECIVYGEEERRKMYSVLFNFEFQEEQPENLIYSEVVVNSLSQVLRLAVNS